MLLRELAAEVGGRLIGDGDVEIAAIEYDSRAVAPGALFVAVLGFTVDGHAYLGRAIERGAEAVVVQEDHEGLWHAIAEGGGADLLVLPDTRLGMARIAAAFHGHPARKLKVVGVTGTDGKTSLGHLLAHVFNASGHKAGLISTAECRIGHELLPDTGRFTTPEAPQVQQMLSQMVEAGCEWAVVEATSHGLALNRVDECEYDIAAFTNLGLDHIDFHGTAEDYRDAKGRLFELLGQSADKGVEKTAVLNADDPACAYFRGRAEARVATYGIDAAADVRGTEIRDEGWGVRFALTTPRAASAEVYLPKPGSFNVLNALAAVAIGTAAGLPLDTIVRALETWPGAPGRMELIDAGQPFRVVVDFAHAPESLRRVLRLLRESSGRLIAVFGAIGERDRERRPGMARAAAELADYTFVTDDNPYTEDRDAILQDIAREMRAAGKREGHDFSVVADRREAISQAISMAVDEDSVLLAGKGHEREVHLRDGVYECDDRAEARRVLRELGYGRGNN